LRIFVGPSTRALFTPAQKWNTAPTHNTASKKNQEQLEDSQQHHNIAFPCNPTQKQRRSEATGEGDHNRAD
jgi:hypothetical protein